MAPGHGTVFMVAPKNEGPRFLQVGSKHPERTSPISGTPPDVITGLYPALHLELEVRMLHITHVMRSLLPIAL